MSEMNGGVQYARIDCVISRLEIIKSTPMMTQIHSGHDLQPGFCCRDDDQKAKEDLELGLVQ